MNRFNTRACIIIGGGPAGAATAGALSNLGWHVTVLDRREKIDQKICGECLSPPSRELLEKLDAWQFIPKELLRPLESITLVSSYGNSCRLQYGSDGPFTIPRPVLDSALLSAAKARGAQVELDTSVHRIERLNSIYRVYSRDGRTWQAPLIVGADGRGSWTSRQLGLARESKPILHRAAIMGFLSIKDLKISGLEMIMAPWGYVGLNPIPSDSKNFETCNVIAVLHPRVLKQKLNEKKNTGKEALREVYWDLLIGESAPAWLKNRLKGAELISEKLWTVSPLAWKPERLTGDGCVLVGDSAGFVDPFTGEGLYHALSSAIKLSAEIENQDLPVALKKYESWHAQVFGPEELFCYLLQKFMPYPWFSDYLLRQLAKKPDLSKVMAEAVADRIPTENVLNFTFWVKVLWPFAWRKAVAEKEWGA